MFDVHRLLALRQLFFTAALKVLQINPVYAIFRTMEIVNPMLDTMIDAHVRCLENLKTMAPALETVGETLLGVCSAALR